MSRTSPTLPISQINGHKKILVIDNDIARTHQLATVLSFVGEHFLQCAQDEIAAVFKGSDHLLTVILAGDISLATANIVRNNPEIPFLLHDVLDASNLNGHVNIIGSLSMPLNYAQLTELVHHCHQYHNKLPRTRGKFRSNALFRSLVGTSKPMSEVRFLIEQ